MGHIYGYGRVSTRDQDPSLQTDALKSAACERIFVDKASGSLQRRPQLDKLWEVLLPGDVVVVWKLDRLGRSMRHLVAVLNDLGERGIEFRSLTDGLDTTTAQGRFFFHVTAAFAELERALIVERTHAGLEAARARGRHGGRPPVMTPEKLAVARQMYDGKTHPVATIAKTVGVSRSTLYRYLQQDNVLTKARPPQGG